MCCTLLFTAIIPQSISALINGSEIPAQPNKEWLLMFDKTYDRLANQKPGHPDAALSSFRTASE